MKKIKPIKAWAVINWNKTAIVNDGNGQKQIYRAIDLAELEATGLGHGTSVIPVKITPLTKRYTRK